MRRFFARLAISIALVLIALVASLVAVGYFLFALYLWLAEYLVPPAAAAISGVIALLLALVLALIARAMLRFRRGGTDAPALSAAETAADVGSALSDKLNDFATMNRGTSMITALMAGFAVGFSPRLRSLLWRLLKRMS
jgi:hypothetical protein